MVGERSDPESVDFDLHRCLSCGATISAPDGKGEEGGEK